ncbi:TolC family protein [Pseudomethylobacillus aquaticus]|uniref:TolC family protein n=1 Tax=Pseudomethylobacillus aquaticus TaxID=2676064 RepID=A0A3N0V088_9PROT|nr:TolC family protein [Pseudomethylobacillus aquaticus]ROH86217.1 TolC family protein [Pseudomethylobacillus aquaticus]
MGRLLVAAAGFAFAMHSLSAQAATTYALDDVIQMAMTHSPRMNIAKAREDGASAALVTARSLINPEVEVGAGPTRYRTPGGQGSNGNWGIGISQPLEYPSVRRARQEVASANIKVANLGTELTVLGLQANVKSAFYHVVQRQAVLQLTEGDRVLLRDIRERVKLRVDVGESPRYELIKADTELLAAERDYQTALTQVLEAKAYLRGLVGTVMPETYDVRGQLPLGSTLPALNDLNARISGTVSLQQIRAAIDTATARVTLQEKLRNPGLTLKAGVEQDPDLSQFRLGLAIPIPVLNQRQGQIAEAAAELRELQAIFDDRELVLSRELNAAYQRYIISQQQLNAFENGLLSQAESVLKVAESAYRFGERGILDYLDAQRTYRMVRKDYLAARYGYIEAILDIEQLLGQKFLGEAS